MSHTPPSTSSLLRQIRSHTTTTFSLPNKSLLSSLKRAAHHKEVINDASRVHSSTFTDASSLISSASSALFSAASSSLPNALSNTPSADLLSNATADILAKTSSTLSSSPSSSSKSLHDISTNLFIAKYLMSCFSIYLDASQKLELEDVTYGLLHRMAREMSHADTERFAILLFKYMCQENIIEALRIWAERDLLMHLKPGLVMRKFVRKLWVPEMERRFLRHATWIGILKVVWERVLPVIGFYFLHEHIQVQMRPLLVALRHKESHVRRDAARCIALLCQYSPGNIIVSVFGEIHQEVMSVCMLQRRLVRGGVHIETLLCTDWNCLEGCIYAYVHLLHALEAVSHRKSKASVVHHSEFHLITSIVLDVLSMSLDFLDHRNILSPSLDLLSRLLSQYSDYCSQWRRQKVLNILEKLVSILNQKHILVSLQAVVLEILGKLALAFLEPVLTVLNDHHYDFDHFVRLLNHQDYLIRANTAVLIGVMISSSIENEVDISKQFFFLLRECRYVHLEVGERETEGSVSEGSATTSNHHETSNLTSTTPHITVKISPVHSKRVTYDDANKLQADKISSTSPSLTHNLFFDSNYSAIRFLLFKLFDSFRSEQSSLALKHFCQAFAHCLPACLYVRELTQHVTPILYAVLQVDASFWAVPYELLNMVSNFDYFILEHYERRRGSQISISELIFTNIIWKYLLDSNEKVREKACEVLISALPQLHLDSAKMMATDFVKQSHEFESDLLKRIISTHTNEHDRNVRVYTSQEISSVVFVLEYVLTRMGGMHGKDALCGVLLLLESLSKEYSSFDETSPYLINYNKGLGAAGEPIYSEYAVEILDNLLNVAKYSTLTSDLKFFSLLMSCVSIHILHFDYKHEPTAQTTQTLAEYLLLLLDMFEAAKTGQGEKDAITLSMLLERYSTLSVSETAMEQLYTSIQRSSHAATSNVHLSTTRENILQALYFLCMFGEQSVVLRYSDEIIAHMHNHYSDSKEKVILCVQELFASLFNRKSNYFRFFISIDQVPVIVNSSQRGMFQNYFFSVRDRNMGRMRGARSHSSLVGAPDQATNLGKSTHSTTNISHILDQFQPLVLRIKHTFKHTHNKDLQTVILFMLSRMVCIGVNFKRLDKDHSFLQHILRLIRDMDVSENTQLLYYINDFVSLLLFMVKFQPKELTEDVLLPTIISGLSNTTWSTALLLQKFTPLLVRSFLYKLKDPDSKTLISNDYGERLLQLFLQHLSFSECMVSLHKLMIKLPKGATFTANVSNRILETLILELKLKVDVNEFGLHAEIDKIFAFLDVLIYHSISSDLYEDLLGVLLDIVDKFTQFDKTAVDTHEAVRCLLAVRLLNLFPAVKSNTYNGKFLACALFCMQVANTSSSYRAEDDGITLVASRILVEVLLHLEEGEMLSLNAHDPAEQLLEVLMKHLCKMMDGDAQKPAKHSGATFHNYINFDGLMFTTGVSILMRNAVLDVTFLPVFVDFCLANVERLRRGHYDEHHVGKIQMQTLLMALLFVMAEVGVEMGGAGKRVQELPDFWQFLCFHSREQLSQMYFEASRGVEGKFHTTGLLEFMRQSLDKTATLSQLRQITNLLSNLGASQSSQIIHFLEEYRAQLPPLRVRDRLLDSVLGEKSPSSDTLKERLGEVRQRILHTPQTQTDVNILFSKPERFSRLPQMIARLSPQQLHAFLHCDERKEWNADFLRLLVDAAQEISNQATMDVLLQYLNEQIEEQYASGITDAAHATRFQLLGESIRAFFNNSVGSKHEQMFFEMHARFFVQLSEIIHQGVGDGGSDHSPPQSFDSSFVYFYLNFTQDFLQHWIRLRVMHGAEGKSGKNGTDEDNLSHTAATLEACKTFLQCTHGDVVNFNPLPPHNTLIQHIVNRLFLSTNPLTVSDTIPFVRSDHRALLERIGIFLLRLNRRDSYTVFFQNDNSRHDYRHMDTLQVVQLQRLFFAISCDKDTFHKLWGFTFDMFKRVSDMTSVDEMQAATLKLMTQLLGRVRFVSSGGSSPNTLLANSSLPSTYNQLIRSTFKYFDPFYAPLHDHSTQLIEPQLLHIDTSFEDAQHINHDALSITVDDIYFQAIIDVFLRFLAGTAMQNHQESNPQFFLEMTKSLAYLMLNNPNLFAVLSSSQKNASILAMSRATTSTSQSSSSIHALADASESVLGFDQAFYFFAKLYQNKLYTDDWMLKQYMMLILLKSSKYISQDERVKHQNLLMKVLQDNLVRKNTRLCGYFGLWILILHREHNLVTKMLTYIAQNMSRWFDESQQDTLELLLLLECMSSLVQNFPVETSMHNISKKYIHSLFELSNQYNISLCVLKVIYKKLNALLENYSLSHEERHMIEKAAVVHHEGEQAWKGMPSGRAHNRKASGDASSVQSTSSVTSTAASYFMPWRRSVVSSSISTVGSTSSAAATATKKRSWFSRKSTPAPTTQTITTSTSDSSSVKTTSSKLTSVKHIESLRQNLLPRISHTQAHRVLKYCLMMTSMYTGESNREGEHSINILEIFQHFRADQTSRESELIVRFIPQIMRDFVDATTNLSLFMSEFLSDHGNARIMALILNAYFDQFVGVVEEQGDGDVIRGETRAGAGKGQKHGMDTSTPHATLDSHTSLALRTLSMKRPTPMALWALQCLFASCLRINAYFPHLLDVGVRMPREERHLSSEFVFDFVYMAVLFADFLKRHKLEESKKALWESLEELEKESAVCAMCVEVLRGME